MVIPDSFTFILQDSLVKVNLFKLFFKSAWSRVGQSESSINYIPFPGPCQAYFAAISRFFAGADTRHLQVAISCAHILFQGWLDRKKPRPAHIPRPIVYPLTPFLFPDQPSLLSKIALAFSPVSV
jgi:hypothetical protein